MKTKIQQITNHFNKSHCQQKHTNTEFLSILISSSFLNSLHLNKMNGYGLIWNNGRSGADLSHSLSLCGPPCRRSCSSPSYHSNRHLGSHTAAVHMGSPLDGNRGSIETLHLKHPIWQRYRTKIMTHRLPGSGRIHRFHRENSILFLNSIQFNSILINPGQCKIEGRFFWP